MAFESPKLRIYQSALNDVRYVYDKPLRFEPKFAEARAKTKENMQLAAAKRKGTASAK